MHNWVLGAGTVLAGAVFKHILDFCVTDQLFFAHLLMEVMGGGKKVTQKPATH